MSTNVGDIAVGGLVENSGRLWRMVAGIGAFVVVLGMVGLSGLPAQAAPGSDSPSGSPAAVETSDGVAPAARVPFAYPLDGDVITAQQMFSGGGFAGQVMKILHQDGTLVCSAATDEDWILSCAPQAPFDLGPLTVTAELTSSDGTVETTGPYHFTVTARPTVASPLSGAVVDDLPVFTGRGEPGADIDILGGQSGLSICSATVAADGSYSCTPLRLLSVGTKSFVPALSKNRGGQVTGEAVTITVAVTPAITSPVNGSLVAAKTVIEGTAGLYTNVDILDGTGSTVCTATTGDHGMFACTAVRPLGAGKHTLTPVQRSLMDGGVSRGAGIEVTVAATEVAQTSTATASATGSAAATIMAAPVAEVKPKTALVLAETGAGIALPGAIGGLLLGAGALGLTFRRRLRG
ncbi:hypothetical protein ACX80E_13620 [Arthrobacter sp. TMN-49]